MTPDVFFITGLPRTRSAWLANFCTYGPGFCIHDVSAEIGDLSELAGLARMIAEESGAVHVGFADTGLGLCWEKVRELLPTARWLIVNRNTEEAWDDFVKFFTATPYQGLPAPEPYATRALFARVAEELDSLEASLPPAQCRRIPWEDLDDEWELEKAVRFLLPTAQWNPRRWHMLNLLRINTAPDKRHMDVARTAGLIED